jgi:hypothetical protein
MERNVCYVFVFHIMAYGMMQRIEAVRWQL